MAELYRAELEGGVGSPRFSPSEQPPVRRSM
jgi:hypothetical protein